MRKSTGKGEPNGQEAGGKVRRDVSTTGIRRHAVMLRQLRHSRGRFPSLFLKPPRIRKNARVGPVEQDGRRLATVEALGSIARRA